MIRPAETARPFMGTDCLIIGCQTSEGGIRAPDCVEEACATEIKIALEAVMATALPAPEG